ncbi:MAG: hypothetical protein LBT05_16580 [Planctomycetaceae bacterium]|jgi:hypothetical protein|nr:hypothetical protein [Planctomycetaceae bacterium]
MFKIPYRHNYFLIVFFLIFAVVCLSGCCLDNERWRKPNFLHPGTLEEQRYNMNLSDTLPAPGIGIDKSGLRPRDADRPWDAFSPKSEIYLAPAEKSELIQP